MHAVTSRIAWAITSSPANAIVRTTNGGRTWQTVLSHTGTSTAEAFAAQGPDRALAIEQVITPTGTRFIARQTRDAGQTWQQARLPA